MGKTMIKNLSEISFEDAVSVHFSSPDFKSVRAENGKTYAQCVWGMNGGEEVDMQGLRNTCAIRLSLALHLAGARFEFTPRAWYYDEPTTRRKEKILLPSSAGDYYDKMRGGVRLENQKNFDKTISLIKGYKGILFIGMAVNHITFWDGSKMSSRVDDKKDYVEACRFAHFWPMG